MKCQCLFSGKIKQNIASFLSANLALMVKVKHIKVCLFIEKLYFILVSCFKIFIAAHYCFQILGGLVVSALELCCEKGAHRFKPLSYCLPIFRVKMVQ